MSATAGFRRTRVRPARTTLGRRLSRWRRRSAPWARRFWRWGGWVLQQLRAAPRQVQLVVLAAAIVALFFALNGIYQVVRKPAELFFPVAGTLNKAPAETWRKYEPLFRKHSTAVMTPELLAALAQVEGAGNPVARTYWRWRFSWNPFEMYQPASTAVGMYQITNAAFRDAKRYCVHNHVVVEDGPWHDWSSCWFNSLYTRTIPSHAVEMTSAYLDRQVEWTLARRRIFSATLQQKQDMAALIHLCGPTAGDAYARRGFQLTATARCVDHDARIYLARVNAMKRYFAFKAAASEE
ncbi:MAG TPA: hypothetical protein VKD25_08610 [Burkholderiales bacterium]|nr:hypothetical protein [Burkholderiales bacterium]